MGVADHHHAGERITPRCAIVTLSDTRTPATDTSGQASRRLLEEDGCAISDYALLPDDPARIIDRLKHLLTNPSVDAIICNGGTGIAKRDQTIDAIARLIETPLPGFGELFRMLSYEQIGAAAMLSRAVGGVCGGKILFALPGSTKAVELGMKKLIIPELRHILAELRKST